MKRSEPSDDRIHALDAFGAALGRAMRESEQRPAGRLRGTGAPRTGLALGAAIAVLVGLAFTPPGRAATDWVADRAGIGDPPTLDFPFDKPGSVVIDSETLTDGTRYELVARVIDPDDRFQDRPGGSPHPSAGGSRLCFGVDVPTQPDLDQDSVCVGTTAQPEGYPPFTSYGTFPLSQGSGPAMLFGLVEDPRVADIEVVEGRHGVEPTIPSKLVAVDPAILERVGRVDPVRIFLSPVSESLARAADRGELDLYAVGLDASDAEVGRAAVLPVPISPAEVRRLRR